VLRIKLLAFWLAWLIWDGAGLNGATPANHYWSSIPR
jgi:hypothetical protein